MDTNNQETVQGDYGFINEMKKNGASREVMRLAKDDYDFGIDKDTVEWYARSGWGDEKVKKFSQILRSTTDQEFIRFIREGNFLPAQMEILLEFHKKDVPLAKLAELMGQEMTPYELRDALSGIYGEMRQVSTQAGGADFEAVKKQMADLAENISKNRKFYESVSEQLKKIGTAGADAEKVREELSAEIDQKDKMLGDQQDNLNKVHAQMAALRSEKAALEKKVQELEEKEGNAGKYEAEAARLKETKEGLEAELKEAREETASVSSELSGAKAERDHQAAELEKEKAENARLNGELEKIRGELEQAKADAVNVRAADTGISHKEEDHLHPSDRQGDQTGNSRQVWPGKQQNMERSVSYGGVSGHSGREQGTAGSEQGIKEDYQTVIRTGGREIPVTVEHTAAPGRDGFFSALGKKLFGDRKRMRIIKAVAAAKLDKEQMKQVTYAIRSGLLENEVIDIINSGFDAEEMEQAVEIVLAEKSY
jgi:hypothetical protein